MYNMYALYLQNASGELIALATDLAYLASRTS